MNANLKDDRASTIIFFSTSSFWNGFIFSKIHSELNDVVGNIRLGWRIDPCCVREIISSPQSFLVWHHPTVIGVIKLNELLRTNTKRVMLKIVSAFYIALGSKAYLVAWRLLTNSQHCIRLRFLHVIQVYIIIRLAIFTLHYTQNSGLFSWSITFWLCFTYGLWLYTMGVSFAVVNDWSLVLW